MNKGSTTLRIALQPKQLGHTEITNEEARIIEERILGVNGQLRDIIAALLDVNNAFCDDVRGLREKFAKLKLNVEREGKRVILVCNNTPNDALIRMEEGTDIRWDIMKRQKDQISAAIRDVCLRPGLPGDDATPQEVSEWVRYFVERTGLLERSHRRVTFVWGGHRTPDTEDGYINEYDYAKNIGYHDAASNGTELITGCGPGIMKAPFKGALNAWTKRELDRFMIGFTEVGIIAAEAPNSLIDQLVIFPNIETRIEAFIRASQRGRVHPGGVGTMEEILTFLGIMSHENNDDIHYPFDLVDRPGGTWMENVHKYIRRCVGTALDHRFQIHVGRSPSSFAQYVMETNRNLDQTLWNNDLYFPAGFQKPFETTFESIEGLDLTRNQPTGDLMLNLVRFFGAMVTLTVKKPEIVESWGTERPLLKGDEDIVEATETLLKEFAADKRIPKREGQTKIFRTKKE